MGVEASTEVSNLLILFYIPSNDLCNTWVGQSMVRSWSRRENSLLASKAGWLMIGYRENQSEFQGCWTCFAVNLKGEKGGGEEINRTKHSFEWGLDCQCVMASVVRFVEGVLVVQNYLPSILRPEGIVEICFELLKYFSSFWRGSRKLYMWSS